MPHLRGLTDQEKWAAGARGKARARSNIFGCVICRKSVAGLGNNPAPIAQEGDCCDDCNMDVVAPARMRAMQKSIARENAGGG